MTASPAPVVDVLMTAFNAGSTVVSSAQSILGQSFTRLRLIVVNDGSTDDTATRLDELAAYDSRMLVLHQHNTGIVNAARAGLAHCTAEFVARQDADDLSFPQRLSRQLAHLARNPECVAVSGAAYHIDEHDRRTGFLVALDPPDRASPTSIPSREPYIMHPFMLARRESMLAAGGYRDVEYAEDTDLCWRMQELGRLDNMSEALGEYRVHTASVSSSSVVSGRISAMNSQLSAISATRRRRGRPDLQFTPADVGRYREAESFAAMLDLVAPQLEEQERHYLRVASAAKLLELSLYRPYRLDVEDCRHIDRACLAEPDGIDAGMRGHLHHLGAAAAAKMIRERRFREAAALATHLRRRSVIRQVAEQTRWAATAARRNQRPRVLGGELVTSEADRVFLQAIAARP